MSIIIPARRETPPSRESVRWLSPVRSESLIKLAKSANHLAAFQGRLHLNHTIQRGSAQLLAADPGGEPVTTYVIEIPPVSLHSSHLEVVLRFQGSEGYPSESDEAAGINFTTPSIKVSVLTSAGAQLDPPPGAGVTGARISSPVGLAGEEAGAGYLNPADLTANDAELGEVWPVVTATFVSPPSSQITQYPTPPRGLNCTPGEGSRLLIVTERARLWQGIVNEAPLLVV